MSGILGGLIWLVRMVGWLVLAALVGPSKANNASSSGLSTAGGLVAWAAVGLGFVVIQPIDPGGADSLAKNVVGGGAFGGVVVFFIVMGLDWLDSSLSSGPPR